LKRRTGLFIICSILALLLVGPTPTLADGAVGREDLEGVKVAIWGETDDMVGSSRIALHAMFEWMNATVDYINGEDVRLGTLDEYDILAMPGGQMSAYFSALGSSGIKNLKQWVANGGSYFGICGGALFVATSRSLGIYNGTYALEVPGDTSSVSQMAMQLNTTCEGPNLSSLPENFSTLYWGSSYFIPAEGFDYIPIARFQDTDGPGMIAFEYEHGNAFLSSPHPEYEEGSTRDGTTEFDAYIDPDTEWDFLLRIAIWQVESSLPEDQGVGILMFGLGIVGIVAVVLIVLGLRRRA